MQENIGMVSDRLPGILSDLSSFISQDSSSAALPVCESRDRDSFVRRVRSFKSSSWFAKPRWLSPVICARYGWINVDVDLLRCVGCQSVLVVRTPMSFDPAVYDACQQRFEDQLRRAAHHPCCTWPSCPTPEVIILAHGGSSSQASVVKDFINKVLLLHSLEKDLPAIEDSCLNVTESDITDLCNLVRSSSKFLHDAEIPGALQSAVLLALTGWDISNSGKTFTDCTSVQCSLCMRQPGLWNYISVTGTNDQVPDVDSSSNGDPLLDHQMSGVKESAHSHSPCDIIDGQISLDETDGMQSVTDTISSPAPVEDLLPKVTTDKCVELSESSLLSQDVESVNDTQDRLPHIYCKDDNTDSLAVNSDNHDDSEAIANDMPGETDTYELGDHSDTAASVGDDEIVACDILQMTDNHLCYSGTVEEERDNTVDICVTEETKLEQSEGKGAGLDSCLEVENQKETKRDETGSAVEETINDSANMLTACDDHVHISDLCESVNNSSPDKSVSLDAVVDDVCANNNPEDISYVSSGPAASTVSDDVNANMEVLEEAIHEGEGRVQCEEPTDDVDSVPQEMSTQENSVDANTQEMALDLTSSVSHNDLQQGGSDGESERSAQDPADIIEAIRQLLTDIVDDVVQNTGSENDHTVENPLKRHAIDSPPSVPQPPHKRPFGIITRQMAFNPVAEHHLWCPYICDIDCDGTKDVVHKPWLRLLRQLVPDPEAALSRVQSSPVPEGIERIRKLFRSWTSAA